MRAAMALGVEANEQDAMAMADMFEVIDTCPVPVVARVHGAALGGGMGLCAVADIVIAESGARFGFTETRLGILPSVISPFVIAKIGESHARALFPGGRRFDATRAARIGLVHEIVEGEPALDAAVEAAVAEILQSGPTATRAAKAIVREVRGLGHGSAKWHTARVIARQRATEEAQEGFRAFSERRRACRGRRTRAVTDAPCRGEVDAPIHTVFIANRGEIAARIARTCDRLGIRSVAPSVTGPDGLDLLDVDAVTAAALAAGADAVHPGFGFLAENAVFAEHVTAAGMRWIGPPPAAIRAMGDKAAARRLAASLGVPVLAGLRRRGSVGRGADDGCGRDRLSVARQAGRRRWRQRDAHRSRPRPPSGRARRGAPRGTREHSVTTA